MTTYQSERFYEVCQNVQAEGLEPVIVTIWRSGSDDSYRISGREVVGYLNFPWEGKKRIVLAICRPESEAMPV